MSDPVYTRLDHFLASSSWLQLFPSHVVTHLNGGSFDHLPLLLSTDCSTGSNQRFKLFLHFEPLWLQSVDNCPEVFSSVWWDSGSNPSLFACICSAHDTLRTWSRSTFGHIPSKIAATKKILGTDLGIYFD